MSRYDWPPPRRRRRQDEVITRVSYNTGTAAGADPEGIEAARTMRGLFDAASHAGPERRAAPTRREHLWQPIGPSTTVLGGGDADPRVAGRVRDLAVSPDAQRIYAASALGGLWYSGDAGATWEPVGPWSYTVSRADIEPSSMTLACGAVYVRFDATGDVARDEVWVGTGEPHPNLHRDFGVVGNYRGVGILHAVGPVVTSRNDPNRDPWERQAQPHGPYRGLRGAAVFAFAADPTNPRRLLAATIRGLHQYDPAANRWSLVTVQQWEDAIGVGGSRVTVVTDVVWVGTAAGPRVWIAAGSRQNWPEAQGVWRSETLAAESWTRVSLPGVTSVQTLRRIGLAAAPSDPSVLYVLANGPRLWRIDGDSAARPVRPLPSRLFGDSTHDQSEYDLALAVDPRNPQRILLGGSAVESTVGGGRAAALYRLTLREQRPTGSNPWPADYVGGNARDPRWVGAGVHADVHRLRWPEPGSPRDPTHVIVACDGGVFRSPAEGDRFSFTSRSLGLAVSEPGFVACHPQSDGVVLAGFQDNGVQLRVGESVWRRALQNGDGGGVAFDPARPHRFVGQAFQAFWTDDADASLDPTVRSTENAVHRREAEASRFYSNPAVFVRADGTTQLAVGTTRVWYSEQWGRSVFDPGAGIFRRRWVTLPSNRDPRRGDALDTRTDVLPPERPPGLPGQPDVTGIRALRWGTENRLYAVVQGAVYRLDRDEAGTWTRTTILTRAPAGAPPAPPAPGPHIHPDGALNDLAVDNARREQHGSFYLATSHPEEPVWWFDGRDRLYPSGLGVLPPPPPLPPGAPDGVRAPAYSVVVDDRPAAHVVYAGTTVGVWRAERTFDAAGVPTWRWTPFNNGLPEAAAQDLVLASYPVPFAGTVRLLRAAVQARGVWEVQLDGAAAPNAYLRVHPYDTRRISPTVLADPMFAAGAQDREWHLDWADLRNRDFRTPAGAPAPHPDGTQPGHFLWHASPDVRIRPAPGSPPPPAHPTLPWTSQPADRFALWALQTALHSLEPGIVPNGRWSPMLGVRLRALRHSRLGLSDRAVVDAGLWNHPEVRSRFWRVPWDGSAPTEADLVERMVGMATTRPGGPAAAAVSPASLAVRAGSSRVEVCVHGRGVDPLLPEQVSVLLLRCPLPADPADWGTQRAPDLGALEAPLRNAPSAGGPLPPGTALPAGWQAADSTIAIRRPAQPIGAGRPAVVRFDVDFTAPACVLLVAVVHAGPGTPEPSGAAQLALADLVLSSPHVAARSVEVM